MRIWECKIGGADSVPTGADAPMRGAIAKAYRDITGKDCDYIFSGWGGRLTENELAVVENRLPDPAKCERAANTRATPSADDARDAIKEIIDQHVLDCLSSIGAAQLLPRHSGPTADAIIRALKGAGHETI